VSQAALEPNEGKSLSIEVDAQRWARVPVRTHVITGDDDLNEVIARYAAPHLREGDLLFMSERMVAITQGRAYPIDGITPSRLANFLVRFVTKTPAGIGLGSGWTMELAIREVGAWRILLAAAVAAVTKPFGVRGMFYRVAGRRAAAIDGPCDNTLPPYNRYATLGPSKPNEVARALRSRFGVPIVIIDANDLGVEVLGRTPGVSKDWARAVFRDNPLGQSSQQTPLCIVRRAST
jgi:F420-0:gamma-glutamyl ligase-like protein